jgi:magnesium chelatase family protein
MIRDICVLDTKSNELMEAAMDRFELSARAYYRILKVARTIADLEDEEKILPEHVSEALQYRKRGS